MPSTSYEPGDHSYLYPHHNFYHKVHLLILLAIILSDGRIKIPALPYKLYGQAHYTVRRYLVTHILKVYDL